MTQYEVNHIENRMLVDSEWFWKETVDTHDPYDPFWVPEDEFEEDDIDDW